MSLKLLSPDARFYGKNAANLTSVGAPPDPRLEKDGERRGLGREGKELRKGGERSWEGKDKKGGVKAEGMEGRGGREGRRMGRADEGRSWGREWTSCDRYFLRPWERFLGCKR